MPRQRIYNMYPLMYRDLESMTADLGRVAEMGFTAVTVNPLHEVSQTVVDRGGRQVSGSLYAMRDFSFNPRFGDPEQAAGRLRCFTARAKELGMIPIFDLVLDHAGVDNPLVENLVLMRAARNEGKFIDPIYERIIEHNVPLEGWFQRNPDGSLHIHRDENGENPWDDVALFDYSDEQTCSNILHYVFKYFIRRQIEEYGFAGARLDAAAHLPPRVVQIAIDYLRESMRRAYGDDRDLIILAETLGKSPGHAQYVLGTRDENALVTHVMNNVFWRDPFNGHEQFVGNTQELQAIAETLGFAGSHDNNDLLEKAAFWYNPETPEGKAALSRLMAARMADAAFLSDGHIVLSGNEVGRVTPIHVFTREHDADTQTARLSYFPFGNLFDLQDFVRSINDVLAVLPEPSRGDRADARGLDSQPNLIVYTLQCNVEGQKVIHRVLVNKEPTTPILLNAQEKCELGLEDNDPNLHCCQGVSLGRMLHLAKQRQGCAWVASAL